MSGMLKAEKSSPHRKEQGLFHLYEFEFMILGDVLPNRHTCIYSRQSLLSNYTSSSIQKLIIKYSTSHKFLHG